MESGQDDLNTKSHLMLQRKSLEPVQEEMIENEIETPVQFPIVKASELGNI